MGRYDEARYAIGTVVMLVGALVFAVSFLIWSLVLFFSGALSPAG
jgi:hypothetical protein